MIKRLTLRNFKSVREQVYDFTQFDLLVGRNNSGKSTILQALAIWQFCVDEFRRSKRTGTTGTQVVLPNFTALPVPEFNLLWRDRTDREYPVRNGSKSQEYILIEIEVEWPRTDGTTGLFGVALRYHSPQTIYAIPKGGWKAFRDRDAIGDLPNIAYVPPFSGLEPTEKSMDISPIRQQVGKAQPGAVLRNLLLQVSSPASESTAGGSASDWNELADIIFRWFSVRIHKPVYNPATDVYITVEYKQGDKNYDIIVGGSGFHQTLTLLAFFYGYHPTTILLDEPDAHLHVNLQREILDYFKKKSLERNVQFLIATHAEELVRGVDATQIVSLLKQGVPERIQSVPSVLRAMSDVPNEEITQLLASPFILYVEGESDERILRNWADRCGATHVLNRFCFRTMGGGSKKAMHEAAKEHFEALHQIIPTVQRKMLFDYDSSAQAFHPGPNNPALAEWKRKNIENYLLVPESWKRALQKQIPEDLLAFPWVSVVDSFFIEQNLTLPPGRTWRNVTANIFSVVDGKRILFEDDDSLFQRFKEAPLSQPLIREHVALNMMADEIHEDVHRFFESLAALVGDELLIEIDLGI
jgi:AAA domain, putative AbiEii toxin, Type IV TA system/AAA ATPase domain